MKRAWGDEKAADEVVDTSEGMINVDSPTTVTHNYYTDPNTPKKETPSALGTLAKMAIGAGLISTGAGAAVGVPLLIDALKDGKTVVERKTDNVPIPAYTLDLGPPSQE